MKEANRVGRDVSELGPQPSDVARLVTLVEDGTLSGTVGRAVLGRMVDSGRSAAEIVKTEGLSQVHDPRELEVWVDAVLAESPDEVARYRAGEVKLIGHFIGRVMHRSDARADPKAAVDLIRDRLRR